MPCRLCIERCYSGEARDDQGIDLVWVFVESCESKVYYYY